MNDLILKTKEIIIDVVFPEICLCGKWGEVICADCRSKIKPYKTQLCPICKRISENGKTCKSCYPKCHLTGVMVYGRHEGMLKDAIWRYKYQFVKGLGQYFGAILALEFGPELIERDFLVTFVPISIERQRWRGFNQAELIAAEVAKRTDLEFKELLVRKGKNDHQVGLNRRARLANLKGKIEPKEDVNLKNKKVLIIDDVLTTGATLSECASALRLAGASEVWGLVLSRD